MTAAEIVEQLQELGTDGYKRILLNHGVREPVFGVKIEELKKFQKRIKRDYQLALDLYDTGIYDAQYLAGLIADDAKMTKKDLKTWLAKGNCTAICGTALAGVAAGSRYGFELARDWIDSKKENVAQTGWTIFSLLVAITDDADLDLAELKSLLQRIATTIHQQPNRVRYAMNGFVISVGCYVSELTNAAIKLGEKIGTVEVDMGNTACKVPSVREYIEKVQKRGTIGKKRKSAKC